MKIYLLRHGEIEHEGEKKFIGHTNVPLSEIGRNQARWWRTALEHVAFRRIYCSDLSRARQSAEILAAGSTRSVTVSRQLREIDLGQWDGLTAKEIKTRFPGEWEKRGLNISEYRPVGGESFAALSKRVVPVFETITDDSEGAIVVVGHAGVNRVVLCHVLGMPVSSLFHVRQDYGALNIIEGSHNSWQVSLMNLTPESAWTLSSQQLLGDKHTLRCPTSKLGKDPS
jgi:alpha-ribazole phosphatase